MGGSRNNPSGHPARFTEALLPLFAQLLPVQGRVLDVFGGTGEALGRLRTDYGVTCELWATELQPHFAGFTPRGVTMVVANALHLPFPDHSFDMILTSPVYGNRMCLAENTLVLTERGHIPIQSVDVGDRVLTHLGRWKEVIWAGSTGMRETVTLIGQGGWRITSTLDHRFLARRRNNASWKAIELGLSEWIEAQDMEKQYWSSPTHYDPLPFPELPSLATNSAFWWFVGFWLANGWVMKPDRTLGVCNNGLYEKETDELLRRAFGDKIRSLGKGKDGVARWAIHSQELVHWMLHHFGKNARGKRIPGWAMTLDEEWSEELLQGFIHGDGCRPEDQTRGRRAILSSINPEMLRGFQSIATRLGYGVSFSQVKKARTEVVAHRLCNCAPAYHLRVQQQRSRKEHTMDQEVLWQVRDVVPSGKQLVFDLVVKDDHSFLANNIIVHNSDHHNARDASPRMTYFHRHRQATGRGLHKDNAGLLHWGPTYRDFHTRAWKQAIRVLRPGGRMILNCKNFLIRGQEQKVTEWHIQVLQRLGLHVDQWLGVQCPGMRCGANSKQRLALESVVVFRKAGR